MPARIIVLAKAPVAGQVKTRLIPRLGAAGAAALHRSLVERTLRTALAAHIGPVELCCAPNVEHAYFNELARAPAFEGITLSEQGEGDLGARMSRAIERGLATDSEVVLIGSDCPTMDAAYLRRAASDLRAGAKAVFGPAEDGGYVLVGMRALLETKGMRRALFVGIPWSTSQVMGLTRTRLREAGIDWTELPVLWDVDRPRDYERYIRLTNDSALSVGQQGLQRLSRGD